MLCILVVSIASALIYSSQNIHARIPVRKNKKIGTIQHVPTQRTAPETTLAQIQADRKAQTADVKIVEDKELAIKKQHLAGNINETKPWAYALYATDIEYARVAAINIIRLRRFGNTSVSDIVVLVTPNIPLKAWHLLHNAGASHILERSPLRATNVDATWAMSTLKFFVFGLVMWKRVVYIDSDGLVLSRMDHLFDIPMNATHTVAMARAYWLSKGRTLSPHNLNSSTSFPPSTTLSPPLYTSVLIVCIPSETLFEDINRVFRATHKEDMPVINEALGPRIIPLSHLDVPLVTHPYHLHPTPHLLSLTP